MNFTFHEGPATKKLAEIIPLQNLKVYLACYFAMSEINIQEADPFCSEELEKAILAIGTMYEKKMIPEDNAKYMLEYLLNAYVNNTSLHVKIGFNSGDGRKQHHDYPFEFLLHALCYDAQHYSNGRRKFKEILHFLEEHKMVRRGDYSPDALSARYKRLAMEETWRNLTVHMLADDADKFSEALSLFSMTSDHDVHDGFLCALLFSPSPTFSYPGPFRFSEVRTLALKIYERHMAEVLKSFPGVKFNLREA